MAKTRKKAVKRQARSAPQHPELVTWALHGIQQAIEAAREKLSQLESQARRLRGASRSAAQAAAEPAAEAPAAKKTARKKRTLSADARKRIADAQKRRWAKVRAKKSTSSS